LVFIHPVLPGSYVGDGCVLGHVEKTRLSKASDVVNLPHCIGIKLNVTSYH
jgi:hypothetical protein